MREVGDADGANLRLEVADAQGDLTRLPRLARELVGREVDVIVAANPAGVGAAVGATRSVPIVMGTMSDPVPALRTCQSSGRSSSSWTRT